MVRALCILVLCLTIGFGQVEMSSKEDSYFYRYMFQVSVHGEFKVTFDRNYPPWVQTVCDSIRETIDSRRVIGMGVIHKTLFVVTRDLYIYELSVHKALPKQTGTMSDYQIIKIDGIPTHVSRYYGLGDHLKNRLVQQAFTVWDDDTGYLVFVMTRKTSDHVCAVFYDVRRNMVFLDNRRFCDLDLKPNDLVVSSTKQMETIVLSNGYFGVPVDWFKSPFRWYGVNFQRINYQARTIQEYLQNRLTILE